MNDVREIIQGICIILLILSVIGMAAAPNEPGGE